MGKDTPIIFISSIRERKEKDEGGIIRVKLALCRKPFRSPPWISDYDRERGKPKTLNLATLENYSTKSFLLRCQT